MKAWWTALPMAVALPSHAFAQQAVPVAAPEPAIEFSAESVTYDSDSDFVTANGAVRMARDGNYLAADEQLDGARRFAFKALALERTFDQRPIAPE